MNVAQVPEPARHRVAKKYARSHGFEGQQREPIPGAAASSILPLPLDFAREIGRVIAAKAFLHPDRPATAPQTAGPRGLSFDAAKAAALADRSWEGLGKVAPARRPTAAIPSAPSGRASRRRNEPLAQRPRDFGAIARFKHRSG